MMTFRNQTALVTGAASGIGLATANVLSSHGAHIIGIDLAKGQDVADEAMWDALTNELATLDLAVINAGISFAAPISECTLADWRRVLSVNLDGTFLTLRAAMRAMQAHGRGGSIVIVSSASAIKAEVGIAAYAASKAALLQLMRVAAKEGAEHGIRVNAIAPAGVDTPMWDAMPFFAGIVEEAGSREAAIAAMGSAGSLTGRFAHADEIAGQILFLLGNRTMTGSVLTVDGGYSL
jgi:NAD(P)-dependent dehydrogenase (short-subunit alcohol dehydrogenase family)